MRKSDFALFFYKCTELYHPEAELGVLWNDSNLAIPWPVDAPIVSQKDQALPPLGQIPQERLPKYHAR